MFHAHCVCVVGKNYRLQDIQLSKIQRRSSQLSAISHQLLEAAWNLGHDYRSNVIEVYVRYLREKIDRPFGVRSLETVRGLGYRLRRDGGK